MELKDVAFSFLDFPKLELDTGKLIAFFDKYKTTAATYKSTETWQIMTIEAGEWYRNVPIGLPVYDKEAKQEFPDLMDLIYSLPVKLERVQIWENIIPVGAHQDTFHPALNCPWPGPKMYRLMLVDPECPTFYMSPNSEHPPEEQRIYPKFDQVDTNIFCFTNEDVFHGSAMRTPGTRKLLIQLAGHLDVEKHIEILQRSVVKYKDHVITVDQLKSMKQ
jgi:hypothetical protein